MFIGYTQEQQELREELRTYFAQLITPQIRQQIRNRESGELYKQLIEKMGADGWLALGWPKQYGGQGRTATEQLIFFEEALLAKAPIPFVTLNTVGPALMAWGCEQHKQAFLPSIAAGKIHFAIGYTEAHAGTDLAALSTSAIEDGDYYIINGSKVFTSGAESADYIWLAVRTDVHAKHKGISIFMVDTQLEGFSLSAIHTIGGFRTNITYYDNVRVHKSMLVGELNKGWQLITAQLNHERIGLAAWGINAWGLYQRTLHWARSTQMNGKRIIDDPTVQMQLAEAYARLEAMRILNARMAWELDQKRLSPALASSAKVYSTETVIEVCRILMEIIGPASLLRAESSSAVLEGDLEHEYRRCQINTFGGGVNEIQRGIVANFGLGMPRHR